MLVPRHWAEASARGRVGKRRVTVRRFGWSDASPEEAARLATERAEQALRQIASGESLARRERKVPYGGADGLPIREEIVAEHGSSIVTRNAYGALCLNTPDVLFADVDFAHELGPKAVQGSIAFVVASSLAVGFAVSWWAALGALVGLGILVAVAAAPAHAFVLRLAGGPEAVAMRRIRAYVASHPEVRLRVHRTPAGLRVVALHATFDARSPEVAALFAALGADPTYVRMCQLQRCFRARVSPKPWRVGIERHLKPRPGVWPVAPSLLPERRRWIETYDAACADHAACRFLETLGNGFENPRAREVSELHDTLAGATRRLPIA